MKRLVADVETISSHISSLNTDIETYSKAITLFKNASLDCSLSDISSLLDSYKSSIDYELVTLYNKSDKFLELVYDSLKMYSKYDNDFESPFKNYIYPVIKEVYKKSGIIINIPTFEDMKAYFDDGTNKFYSFSLDPKKGNPFVWSADAPDGIYPGKVPQEKLKATGRDAINKLICCSYASSRFWQRNEPDGDFPLQIGGDGYESWDVCLHYSGDPNTNTDYLDKKHNLVLSSEVSDDYKPKAGSIIGISYNNGELYSDNNTIHDAFIEGYTPDGKIVISETNVPGTDNDYGYRVAAYDSIDDWLVLHNNATITGYIEPY